MYHMLHFCNKVSKNNETFVIYFVELCTYIQQTSNPEKSLIVFKVMVHSIWPPVAINSWRELESEEESRDLQKP